MSVTGSIFGWNGDNNSQLALNQQRAGADHSWWAAVGVLNDEDKVAAVLSRYPVITVLELLLCDVAHRRQNAKAIEKTGIIVGWAKRAQLVSFGQRRLHLRGEQIGGEELFLGGHCEFVRVSVTIRFEGVGVLAVVTSLRKQLETLRDRRQGAGLFVDLSSRYSLIPVMFSGRE